ncbi:MAG: formate dehydrogenase accessory sulfurtransferase FdhD [Polaromonas sp.]|uniref:formate dehydrogenase accessory sulfurtransferase FdhD n=1 Tax=Polaromonas sp. TaxID=1869339 RepID=UPI004035DC7E
MNAMTSPERAALVQVAVEKWRNDQSRLCHDNVAEEVPVALEYNGISHAVMLASPYDLEDFALGFSLSEGILAEPSELFDCEVSPAQDGIQVQMRIAGSRFARLKDKRRNLTGRTGCGLCGAETLQQAIRSPAPVTSSALFAAHALYAGMEAMQTRQQLQQQTGATHAAAWMAADGTIALVREDIGRHNALDKLIGAMAANRDDFSTGAALITSRASYEMVQKAATLGIGFLAAISAPTSLAVQLAEDTGVTLVGFTRHQSHVVYAHARRLLRAAN